MKRGVKKSLIVSGILGAAGAVLVLTSVFMGAHFSDIWNGNLPVTEFQINNNTIGFSFDDNKCYQPSNPYSKENKYSVAAEGIDALQINWVAGEVAIRIGETDQILFSESGIGLTEKTALQYGIKDHTLYIQYCKDSVMSLGWDGLLKKLTLTVPRSLAEKLAELRIEVVSADVQLDGAAFRVDRLDFETVSGNLNAMFDSAGEMAMETVSGNITVSGAVNEFEAESVSGKIVLDCRNGVPNELDVDTTSGDVVFYLPDTADLSLEYETVSGDFDSTRAVSIHGETYMIGNGYGDWRVETVSGNLLIK